MALSRNLDDAGVSSREAEVLGALAEHLTNAEIAERLYISVRTVESHVSSLLRKLGAEDRRALGRVAVETAARAADATDRPAGAGPAPPADHDGGGQAPPLLPSPLTPFVGRVAERRALARALESERLVTALGPGGVGKTRLALAVAGDVADRFAGGVWYVDLVPVTARSMVTPTIAAALGVTEQLGRQLEDSVVSFLGARRTLLVLDNCEHLVDGVAVVVERLLTRCPGLTVLATSRIRLVLPFERPFPVPGLSLPEAVEAAGTPGDEAAAGDAVALFLARAEAVGAPVESPADIRRVADVCRALDGVALAIELAVSRLPALGLDGLEAGLADRLRILTGGSRADDRHQSLRATLDWSFALAGPVDRSVLRRVAVFTSSFTAGAAGAVAAAGSPGDTETTDVPDALARLVDQSLLVLVHTPDETRYRVLEIVRQYAEDAAGPDEWAESHDRHLAWCLATAASLPPPDQVDDAWRAAFDRVADELRAGLRWATAQQGPPTRRAAAHDLALALAGLAYRRGREAEAQQRYEESATLTDDGAVAAQALHRAAVVASNRHVGDEAFTLHQASAEAALRAGDTVTAARGLALAATLLNRGPGIMTQLPPEATDRALMARAKVLAVGHPELDPVMLVAEAFEWEMREVASSELAARAVDLAGRYGDQVAESAALDMLTAGQLVRGENLAAADSVRRRTDLLASLPMGPEWSFERTDAYQMAAGTAWGAGDVDMARRFAEKLAAFPGYRDSPHLGLARRMVFGAVVGEWDGVMVDADRFLAGWESAGRPIIGHMAPGPQAAALVHAMRGDDEAAARWFGIGDTLKSALFHHHLGHTVFPDLMRAYVHLHRGEYAAADAQLPDPRMTYNSYTAGMWRHWCLAAWAEAATLAALPAESGGPGAAMAGPEAGLEARKAADRRALTRLVVAGNPVAMAVVERSEALATGDRARLLAAAAVLGDAGLRYQSARTLAFAGGAEAEAGRATLAALGATPMAVPAGAPS